LFEAVQKKMSAHQSHKTLTWQKADHLLRDLLFDDAGVILTLDLRPRLSTAGLESARDILGEISLGRLCFSELRPLI
jgi:hypothetical protein